MAHECGNRQMERRRRPVFAGGGEAARGDPRGGREPMVESADPEWAAVQAQMAWALARQDRQLLGDALSQVRRLGLKRHLLRALPREEAEDAAQELVIRLVQIADQGRLDPARLPGLVKVLLEGRPGEAGLIARIRGQKLAHDAGHISRDDPRAAGALPESAGDAAGKDPEKDAVPDEVGGAGVPWEQLERARGALLEIKAPAQRRVAAAIFDWVEITWRTLPPDASPERWLCPIVSRGRLWQVSPALQGTLLRRSKWARAATVTRRLLETADLWRECGLEHLEGSGNSIRRSLDALRQRALRPGVPAKDRRFLICLAEVYAELLTALERAGEGGMIALPPPLQSVHQREQLNPKLLDYLEQRLELKRNTARVYFDRVRPHLEALGVLGVETREGKRQDNAE